MTDIAGIGFRDFPQLYAEPPRRFAELYADVPKPYPALAPELIAAKWICHDIYGEEMPSIAADMLEAGYDSPALRRLAAEIRVTCSADVEDLVARMLQEFSVRYPMPDEEAREMLTRQVAREVIAGGQNPWNAARRTEISVWYGTDSNRAQLRAISEIRDALDWKALHSDRVHELTADLVAAFARLGA